MVREKKLRFSAEVRENTSILYMKSQGKSGKRFFEKAYELCLYKTTKSSIKLEILISWNYFVRRSFLLGKYEY